MVGIVLHPSRENCFWSVTVWSKRKFPTNCKLLSVLFILQRHPELYLTFLGAKYGVGTDEYDIKNEVEGTPSGFTPYLVVSKELTGKDLSLQRFALKQERFDNLGQWKHNDHDLITNQTFNKNAYSWPVDVEGEWNKKFDWPMEFFLICKAPPLQKSKKDVAGRRLIQLLQLVFRLPALWQHVISPKSHQKYIFYEA